MIFLQDELVLRLHKIYYLFNLLFRKEVIPSMNRKTKILVCLVMTLFILSLVGMLVIQEPARTMMKNARPGSPFNLSAQQMMDR